ncbi:MAG: hypothetical protein QGF89_01545 [Candidatus Marinimicrobia bacterium]|jgi:hypothetical protein|nr:hypothetical protein [Candidatus Neomarinimicrobiota bacterium]
MKLVYQPLGTVALVGIESNDEQKIIEQYYSFWNHQATGGGLHWMCDTFAYITTSEEKLEKYFFNSSLHLLLNKYPNRFKGEKGGVKSEAQRLANRRMEELKENSEAFVSTDPIVYDYSIGRTEARENPAQVRAFDEEEYKQNAASQRSRLQTV